MLAVLLTLVGAAGLSLVVSAARTNGGSAVTRMNLDHVAEGLTPVDLDGRAAVISRAGTDVIVFTGGTPRLEDQLGWCPNSQTFAGTPSSAAYDKHGIKIGGPSPRSLDRFASHIDGDELVINTADIEYRDVKGNVMSPPAAEPNRQPLAYTPEWEANFRLTPGWCPQR